MEPEISLPLRLPQAGSRRLLRDLHEQVRRAIVDGRLRPGARLPTSRAFATTWDVSRNTALALYDRLQAEGYVVARGKAGTFVAEIAPAPQRHRTAAAAAPPRLDARWRTAAPTAPRAPSLVLDFRLGVPELAGFPAAIWGRLTARAWRALMRRPVQYGDPQGQPALRAAIAHHVAFARAVACGADDVVVTSGAQQAFDLLARVLVTPQRRIVAVENPGYPPAHAAFAAAGARLARVRVDGEGIVVRALPDAARIVYVTPSHQFPLGMALSARRRAELLAFARRRRAVVIEDDYDGEFRFAGRPLDALQTLDRDGSVFYVGTFSKVMFPGLRLGYVIAPAWARAALVAAKEAADGHAPLVAQDALAAFIAEGHLVRHVRRMRRVYAGRRARLLEGLQSRLAQSFVAVPGIAGLHVAAFARPGIDVDALLNVARERGVGLHALRPYYAGAGARSGLVFGYGAIDEAGIADALQCMRDMTARQSARRPFVALRAALSTPGRG